MSDITVARRYAQALYEAAEQGGQMDQTDDDMALIQASLDGAPALARLFASPVVPPEKKKKVVTALFTGKVHPTTLHFLEMLVGKGRERLFPTVVQSYRTLRDAHLGIVEAQARVAHPLREAEEKQVVQALERLTGKRIRLKTETDPSLLGGILLRVGDTVYDGSLRNRLATLRERLMQGTFSN
jgi:F-type H+-transporting ATPase subunit delta